MTEETKWILIGYISIFLAGASFMFGMLNLFGVLK
jgi:hypothetical protein